MNRWKLIGYGDPWRDVLKDEQHLSITKCSCIHSCFIYMEVVVFYLLGKMSWTSSTYLITVYEDNLNWRLVWPQMLRNVFLSPKMCWTLLFLLFSISKFFPLPIITSFSLYSLTPLLDFICILSSSGVCRQSRQTHHKVSIVNSELLQQVLFSLANRALESTHFCCLFLLTAVHDNSRVDYTGI